MFLPIVPAARIATLEWLMFQMGGIGPMLGQAHHFLRFNPGKAPYAEERYGAEAKRLYGVLDRRLGAVPYLAGADLTIADFATWPWLSRWEWQGIDLATLLERPPLVSRACRPARRPARLRRTGHGPHHTAAGVNALVTSASVQRVQAALAAHGLTDRIVELAATARTAEDAARVCNVPVGAIVKSLVFEIEGEPVLALVAGDRRCDVGVLPAILDRSGEARRCDAQKVRAFTGFAIGGVAPVGHLLPLPTAIDGSLARFERLFAAAGHPHCVFATSLPELQAMTRRHGVRVARRCWIAALGRLTARLQEAALGALKYQTCQAAGPAGAGVDADPVGSGHRVLLDGVAMHHDLAAVAVPGEERLADPQEIGLALPRQRNVGANAGVAEEVVAEAESQVEPGQEAPRAPREIVGEAPDARDRTARLRADRGSSLMP